MQDKRASAIDNCLVPGSGKLPGSMLRAGGAMVTEAMSSGVGGT